MLAWHEALTDLSWHEILTDISDHWLENHPPRIASQPIFTYFEFRGRPSRTVIACMDPHSPYKLIVKKYCFLIFRDDTSFFFLFLYYVMLYYLFFYYKLVCKNYFIIILFFHKNYFDFFMFWDVPECSMFLSWLDQLSTFCWICYF